MPPGKKMMTSVPQDLWMESDLSPIQDVSPSVEAAEQRSMEGMRRGYAAHGRQEVSLNLSIGDVSTKIEDATEIRSHYCVIITLISIIFPLI